MAGYSSDGKTNPGMDAALATEGIFFWLILSRGCKVQVTLSQSGQRALPAVGGQDLGDGYFFMVV